jgi:hypothetical protein
VFIRVILWMKPGSNTKCSIFLLSVIWNIVEIILFYWSDFYFWRISILAEAFWLCVVQFYEEICDIMNCVSWTLNEHVKCLVIFHICTYYYDRNKMWIAIVNRNQTLHEHFQLFETLYLIAAKWMKPGLAWCVKPW